METHVWLKAFFVYFLWMCVSMHTWWLVVMSCACQLINYTLATEENVGNIQVCACCNHFPITWNEFYDNTQPNNFEYLHKVQVFQGKKSAILLICIMKKPNLEVPCKRNCFGYWNSHKPLPNFVNLAALASSKGSNETVHKCRLICRSARIMFAKCTKI